VGVDRPSDRRDRRDIWVVIAAYNEAAVIRQVVSELAGEGWSIVVVDDGSRDDTAAAARLAGVTVLRHATNLGQGAALQTGIDFALRRRALAIVTFDADGQHAAEDIPALVAALGIEGPATAWPSTSITRGADVALGSRFLGKDVIGASKRRLALLRGATLLSNRLSGLRLTDAHCGLRALRAEVAPKLRITQDRMAHASQLLAKIQAGGLRVVEVPVTVRYTEHSRRKGQSGLQAIRILFDYFFRSS
jgi:glycosyltransferase involved in cell wall biosynthesis